MTTNSSLMEDLRERGFRLTPQRLVILDILEHHHGHLTPSEIFQNACLRLPGITETTVSRTLDFLTHNGLALVAHIGDGKLVYESASRKHHHLICRECGHTVEIGPGLLEMLYANFQKETGFLIDCSHMTFFGLCPQCIDSKISSVIPEPKE